MKIEDSVKMFHDGQPVLIVEYRSSKAERIRWRDKESRNTLEAPILRFSCEASDGTPYIVNERVPDTFKETEYKSAFMRGEKVILKFTTMSIERGIMHFQGALEPLVS